MEHHSLALQNPDLSLEIIELIDAERISTAQLSDCLGRTGALRGVAPLNAQLFCVGPVRLAVAFDNNNWEMHRHLQAVEAGDVVIVETVNCDDCAVAGELVTRFCLDQRNAAALVVNGNVRDSQQIRSGNYPVWSAGITPVGARNDAPAPIDAAALAAVRDQYAGAIAVCDDSGVVVVPGAEQTPMLLEALHQIVDKEEAWFEAIGEKGMTTYDVVCKGKK